MFVVMEAWLETTTEILSSNLVELLTVKTFKQKEGQEEPGVPEDAGTAVRIPVGLGWTVCVPDGGLGGGDVTHTDTFHTGRSLNDGGLAQVTSI